MKKLLFNMFATIMLLCCFITTDVKADSASGYYPAISLNVPRISQYPKGCGIAAVAQGESYFFSQKDSTYSNSKVYALVKAANNNNPTYAYWTKMGYSDRKTASSETAYLKALYNQLAQGLPVIVYRVKTDGSTHYSTVYAYTGSTTTLEKSGFWVVNTNQDLSYVTKERLTTWLSGASHNNVYITRRSGLPDPSSLVTGIKFAINHPPYQHQNGTTQPILGTISSNYNITSVIAGVYDLSGNKKFAASATPNKKYFNINSLDSKMTFASLANGNYDYKVTAQNANGVTNTYTFRFKVVSSPTKSTNITFTYNPVGATGTIPKQTVAYGNNLVVASGSPLVKTGYHLNGFAAYRVSDKKYFTTNGNGWQTQANINKYGYTKKAYQSGVSYTINSSWLYNPYVDNEFILAAMWEANKYTVKYNANGGKGSMSASEVTYGNPATIKTNSFTREQYVFKGWNLYNENSGKWLYQSGNTQKWYEKGSQPSDFSLAVYASGDTISNLDTSNGDVIQLYAVWEEKQVYITFGKLKFVYNGKLQAPTVNVTDKNGNTLAPGKDYDLLGISDCVSVGKYKITVKLKGDYSGAFSKEFVIVPGKPSTFSAIRYQYGNRVRLSWSKVAGATGYRISYKKPGSSSYTFLKNTSNLYYIKSDLSAGKTYTFKVTPYYEADGDKLYSTLNTAYRTYSITAVKKGNMLVQVKKPVVSKASVGKVKVTWKNVSAETGYQISRSSSSTGTYIVSTYATTNKNSKIISAAKGKKYYYKVRAYRIVDGKKIFGKWSSATAYTR